MKDWAGVGGGCGKKLSVPEERNTSEGSERKCGIWEGCKNSTEAENRERGKEWQEKRLEKRAETVFLVKPCSRGENLVVCHLKSNGQSLKWTGGHNQTLLEVKQKQKNSGWLEHRKPNVDAISKTCKEAFAEVWKRDSMTLIWVVMGRDGI